MPSWLSTTGIVIATVIVGLALPAMVVAYYVIRLAGRTDHILTKIRLLSLEDQYLRVFHLEDWRDVSEDEEMLEKRFDQLFPSYFKGENSLGKYSVPFVLLTVTTIVFAVAVYGALIASPSIPETLRGVTLPFAVAGSLLYVYPLFGQRYAAASLSPLALYDLVRRLWLSVVIGIVAASVMAEEIRSLAAFLGAYVPLATLDLLEKRMFGEQERQQSPRKASLLGIVGGDDQVLVQLENIGVRSTLQLAYDNPLRLFVETGLDIDVCTDLVDQANLHLYVPDKEGRQTLCRYGVRSAVDLMTQIYGELPPRGKQTGPRRIRFLEPDEDLPRHWREPLEGIADAMGLDNVGSLRNTIQMLRDNAHVLYLHALWESFDAIAPEVGE